MLTNFEEIKIWIIGHGNQEHLIREAVTGQDNVELRPFVSSEDYPKLLAAADALLVNERPSLREMSLPSKLTSYLASGRPVVVARESATRKFLGDCALTLDPGDPQGLADSLLKLKEDAALQNSLSEKGMEFAKQNLLAPAGRTKYLEVIEEVLVKAPR